MGHHLQLGQFLAYIYYPVFAIYFGREKLLISTLVETWFSRILFSLLHRNSISTGYIAASLTSQPPWSWV